MEKINFKKIPIIRNIVAYNRAVNMITSNGTCKNKKQYKVLVNVLYKTCLKYLKQKKVNITPFSDEMYKVLVKYEIDNNNNIATLKFENEKMLNDNAIAKELQKNNKIINEFVEKMKYDTKNRLKGNI